MDIASAWQRGNGLAGLKERVWAAGGNLELRSNAGRTAPSGSWLQARLPFPIRPAPVPAEAAT